jgi:hypothetical protein
VVLSQEHHGSKPVPAGLWPPGFKLGDDQLRESPLSNNSSLTNHSTALMERSVCCFWVVADRSFPSALGWALGYAALGTQALVHLTDPITNEGVLPFSAQVLPTRSLVYHEEH